MKKCARALWTLPVVLCSMLQQACSSTVDNVAYVGYIEADLAYVAAPQAGWINSLNAMAGSTIAAGDVLFILDQEQQIARMPKLSVVLRQSDAQVRDNIHRRAGQPKLPSCKPGFRSASAAFTSSSRGNPLDRSCQARPGIIISR